MEGGGGGEGEGVGEGVGEPHQGVHGPGPPAAQGTRPSGKFKNLSTFYKKKYVENCLKITN